MKGVAQDLKLRNVSLALTLVCALTACDKQPAPAAPPEKTATPATTVPLAEVQPLVQKLMTQDGAKDATAEMRLQVEEADGKRAQLEFQLQRKYSPDKVSTFIKVNAPLEDSDKALLAVEKAETATEAFSYLAGLKKLAKLGSSNTLNMRNSKVSVQELLGMEFMQYSYSSGTKTTVDGVELIKVEGQAKPSLNLAFPRVSLYFKASDQQPARFELFNDRQELVKTVQVLEVKPVQNRQTITKLAIEEQQTKRRIKLDTLSVKYDQNLPDKLFTEERLKAVVTSASQKLTQ